jgi:hypothetical protein
MGGDVGLQEGGWLGDGCVPLARRSWWPPHVRRNRDGSVLRAGGGVVRSRSDQEL